MVLCYALRLKDFLTYALFFFCTVFLYLCSGLIQKVMAKNLLNKYVWLVETIYKAKKITYEDINLV